MSRWGKNRPPSFTLPLDALVKEKENTNRPVAARSAGTIGKWGITSFTSMRASSGYGKWFSLLIARREIIVITLSFQQRDFCHSVRNKSPSNTPTFHPRILPTIRPHPFRPQRSHQHQNRKNSSKVVIRLLRPVRLVKHVHPRAWAYPLIIHPVQSYSQPFIRMTSRRQRLQKRQAKNEQRQRRNDRRLKRNQKSRRKSQKRSQKS